MAHVDLLKLPADLSTNNVTGYLAGVRMYVLDTPAGTLARRAAIDDACRALAYAAFLCRSRKTIATAFKSAGGHVAMLMDTQ